MQRSSAKSKHKHESLPNHPVRLKMSTNHRQRSDLDPALERDFKTRTSNAKQRICQAPSLILDDPTSFPCHFKQNTRANAVLPPAADRLRSLVKTNSNCECLCRGGGACTMLTFSVLSSFSGIFRTAAMSRNTRDLPCTATGSIPRRHDAFEATEFDFHAFSHSFLVHHLPRENHCRTRPTTQIVFNLPITLCFALMYGDDGGGTMI